MDNVVKGSFVRKPGTICCNCGKPGPGQSISIQFDEKMKSVETEFGPYVFLCVHCSVKHVQEWCLFEDQHQKG